MRLKPRDQTSDQKRTAPRPVPDVQELFFTPLPNDLLMAVMITRAVNLSEIRLILAVARLSYGFRKPTTGSYGWASSIVEITGLSKSQVSRGLNGLARRGIVVEVSRPRGPGHRRSVPVEYALEPDWRKWRGRDGSPAVPVGFCPKYTRGSRSESSVDLEAWEED